MAQVAEYTFASIEHLEAFTRSLPYEVIPTNIPGAYTSPPVPLSQAGGGRQTGAA
jgi:hypothetical protein